MRNNSQDTSDNPIALGAYKNSRQIKPTSVHATQPPSGAGLPEIHTVGTSRVRGDVAIRYTPRDERSADDSTQR